MPLKTYHQKRNFQKTSEPKGERGERARQKKKLTYVIQKHDASRLHYDFRLEWNGVLLSWAVPKGPSLDPGDKRLAVHVEDHPLEYATFEGVIAEGEYGAGSIMVWDTGHWEPNSDPDEGLKKGALKLTLYGERLHGGWALVRMNGGDDERENWLLIKEKDRYARPKTGDAILSEQIKSVHTGRGLDEIAEEESGTDNNDTGQTKSKKRNNRSSRRHHKHNGRKNPRKDNQKSESNRTAKEVAPASLSKAKKADFPGTFLPQLATLADKIPPQKSWLFEVKYDGYRLIAFIQKGKVRLRTRRGNDWTGRFPTIADELAQLELPDCILDGEIVIQRSDGTNDFQALQNIMRGQKSGGKLVYYLFDIPYCNNHDLSRSPLHQRKELLHNLLDATNTSSYIQYGKHVEGSGDAIYQQACAHGMEGIIAKRKDAPYEQKRSRNWLKIKCVRRQEFVIGGFSKPKGARKHFGALLLGFWKKDELQYCGRVGTGFNEQSLKSLSTKLNKLARKTPPFSNPPTGTDARGVQWVTPELVAEVKYADWTEDGILRQPVYMGLRQDKSSDEVKPEEPAAIPAKNQPGQTMNRRKNQVEIAGVGLTHPDRILFPEQNLTKLDLAQYYEQIADWVLPHVVDRPLALVRCPKGRNNECFFQKHVNVSLPEVINSVMIEEKDGKHLYISISNLAGLIALVQVNALEIHPWGSRIDRLEKPDRLTFDLDPGPDVQWPAIVEAAFTLHDILSALELESFVKTSGGKGLHVVVPLARRASWEDIRSFAEGISRGMARQEQYLATSSKSKRKERIYIDYLRNLRGATTVAAYSTRARPGATVSASLRWEELGGNSNPQYTTETLPKRLASLKEDPWKGFFDINQTITKARLEAVQG